MIYLKILLFGLAISFGMSYLSYKLGKSYEGENQMNALIMLFLGIMLTLANEVVVFVVRLFL